MSKYKTKSGYNTGLFYDEAMLTHTNPSNTQSDIHYEDGSRISKTFELLASADLLTLLYRVVIRESTFKFLPLAHSIDYIKKLVSIPQSTPKQLKDLQEKYVDVYLCKSSLQAALVSASGVYQCCEDVWNGKVNNAFALVRPPGHHATRDEAMGFCILNNVSLAAERMMKTRNLERILIVDWDIHHGNGTQDHFYDNPNVLVISIHRYDNGSFFPYSTDADKYHIGEGRGLGKNINIPWSSAGVGDSDYMHVFHQIVMPVAYEFNPQMVIVCSGFDAGIGDFIGESFVTPAGFAHLTHLLKGLANGKLVLALEGGYNIGTVTSSVLECVKSLLGIPIAPLKVGQPQNHTLKLVEDLKDILRKHYKCFSPPVVEVAEVQSLDVIVLDKLLQEKRSEKLFQKFHMQHVEHEDFEIHMSTTAPFNAKVFIIIQENTMKIENIKIRGEIIKAAIDSQSIFIDPLAEISESFIVHIGISDTLNIAKVQMQIFDYLKALEFNTFNLLGMILLTVNVPSSILDPIVSETLILGKFLTHAFIVTDEQNPKILDHKTSIWVKEFCTIYQPSSLPANKKIDLEPTRYSYGSMEKLDTGSLLKIRDNLIGNCLDALREYSSKKNDLKNSLSQFKPPMLNSGKRKFDP